MNHTSMRSVPRARASDPVTSHLAAAAADKFASTHKGRILDAIHAIELDGRNASPERIAERTGLTVVQIDRRLPEMERKGLVRVVRMWHGSPVTMNGFRVWEAI